MRFNSAFKGLKTTVICDSKASCRKYAET